MAVVLLEHGMEEVDAAAMAEEALGNGIHVRNSAAAGMLPDFTEVTSDHTFAVVVFGTARAVHDPAIDATLVAPSMTSIDPTTVDKDMGSGFDGTKQQLIIILVVS